jgi:hypothetical protein
MNCEKKGLLGREREMTKDNRMTSWRISHKSVHHRTVLCRGPLVIQVLSGWDIRDPGLLHLFLSLEDMLLSPHCRHIADISGGCIGDAVKETTCPRFEV